MATFDQLLTTDFTKVVTNLFPAFLTSRETLSKQSHRRQTCAALATTTTTAAATATTKTRAMKNNQVFLVGPGLSSPMECPEQVNKTGLYWSN